MYNFNTMNTSVIRYIGQDFENLNLVMYFNL